MKREPEEGVLSDAEQDTNGVREHYDLVLGIARKAAYELRVALQHGAPALNPTDAHARHAHTCIARSVNAFAWANRVLWVAAETLRAAEQLPEGDLVDEVLL